MLRYIGKRLLHLILTFAIVSVLIFCIVNSIPGDPVAVIMGTEKMGDPEIIRERLGLDISFEQRLLNWLIGIFKGDLGETYFSGSSVLEVIKPRIPVTLSLALMSLMVAIVLGIPLGIIAALKPNSQTDTAIMGFSLLGVSIPEFFLGLILMFIFAQNLRCFPSGGYIPISESFTGWLRHITLPSLAAGLGQSAYIARLMRSSMLEVLNQDYLITAKAKGQTKTMIIIKHALRNAFLPILTAIGMVFALLLSGVFITETLFRIPGAGSLIIMSIKKCDYPIVQGALLFVAGAILGVNLLIDILYAVIDPRVRYGEK